MMDNLNFISGERLQNLATEFLYWNEEYHLITYPFIPITDIRYIKLHAPFSNKLVIYINTMELHKFIQTHDKYLQNPFIVISHNSDTNITNCDSSFIRGLEHNNCLGVFTQNPGIFHPKIHLLPIGFANSKWPHGNPIIINQISRDSQPEKSKDIYFFFNDSTNPNIRIDCKIQLCRKLPWTSHISDFKEYLIELANYKYAICPEGNGYDTHRLWECIHRQVIPIMKDSVFTRHVVQFLKPHSVIVLNDWNDLNVNHLLNNYEYPHYPLYNVDDIWNKIKIYSDIKDSR